MKENSNYDFVFYGKKSTSIIFAMSKMALFVEELNKMYKDKVVAIATSIGSVSKSSAGLSAGLLVIQIIAEEKEEKDFLTDLKSYGKTMQEFYSLDEIKIEKRREK